MTSLLEQPPQNMVKLPLKTEVMSGRRQGRPSFSIAVSDDRTPLRSGAPPNRGTTAVFVGQAGGARFLAPKSSENRLTTAPFHIFTDSPRKEEGAPPQCFLLFLRPRHADLGRSSPASWRGNPLCGAHGDSVRLALTRTSSTPRWNDRAEDDVPRL